ncbi:DUF969 domain-containing protein [Nocardia terpenica]|uniref:DUF969 family protein n=1 Tax=Nocardia terpenica TaxID=455432 RepID=A0A6G9Z954_9NOCA|nr:DUF969 domain-containing protein [Nocardia terpenica]QIS21950.1 DUF969 family protein [Nocardia terpenica]
MLVLLGVALVVAGFALRLNPMLVVLVSGVVTALLGGLTPAAILDSIGKGFADSRSVTIWVVTLPVIGLLDRFGLQQQAGRLIGKLRVLTTGRLLSGYMLARQGTAALGLTGVFGQAHTVRPLIAPMARGAAERRFGELSDPALERIKAFSAGTDNIGLFFGEDIFIAVGSVLLITGYVNTTYHLQLDPLQLARWAIPTAVCAFVIHTARLLWLDRWLARSGTAVAR